MAPHKLPNYLRTYRKRFALSQKDVAFLLGGQCGANISRYERFERHPSLKTALAFEVIFRVPVRVLFEGLYRDAEITAQKQSLKLLEALGNRPSSLLQAEKLVTLRTLGNGEEPEPLDPNDLS